MDRIAPLRDDRIDVDEIQRPDDDGAERLDYSELLDRLNDMTRTINELVDGHNRIAAGLERMAAAFDDVSDAVVRASE